MGAGANTRDITIKFSGDAKPLEATIVQADSWLTKLGKNNSLNLLAQQANNLQGPFGKLSGYIKSQATSMITGLKSLGIAFGIAAAGIGVLGAAGALLGGALPLIFAGIGIRLLKGNQQIVNAFTSLKNDVLPQLKSMADPLVPVFVNIANQAKVTFSQIAPALRADFAMAAPYIQTLATGLMGMIKAIQPGFRSGQRIRRDGPRGHEPVQGPGERDGGRRAGTQRAVCAGGRSTRTGRLAARGDHESGRSAVRPAGEHDLELGSGTGRSAHTYHN
jgi:hypothetical protein